jgi:hypothetical protein
VENNSVSGGIEQAAMALAFLLPKLGYCLQCMLLPRLRCQMGGLNAVRFLCFCVNLLLILANLLFLFAVLLSGMIETEIKGFSIERDDVLSFTLEFLIGLRIDYQLLLYDQIHIHVLLVVVKVVRTCPAMQQLIASMGQLKTGTLSLPQLGQLKGLCP